MEQILLEKFSLVLVLSIGALALIIALGIILYGALKLFILASDVIGYHILKWYRRLK